MNTSVITTKFSIKTKHAQTFSVTVGPWPATLCVTNSTTTQAIRHKEKIFAMTEKKRLLKLSHAIFLFCCETFLCYWLSTQNIIIVNTFLLQFLNTSLNKWLHFLKEIKLYVLNYCLHKITKTFLLLPQFTNLKKFIL